MFVFLLTVSSFCHTLMDFMPRLESDKRIYSHKIRFQAGRREYASQGTYTCAIGEN